LIVTKQDLYQNEHILKGASGLYTKAMIGELRMTVGWERYKKASFYMADRLWVNKYVINGKEVN
jgi:hypothetical protein